MKLCGGDFYIYPSNSKAKYCSRKCKNKAQTGKTKKNDEKVASRSKKLKGRIPWNKGLTKETDERVRAILLGGQRRPNKSEYRLYELLERWVPKCYEYVGNGEFIYRQGHKPGFCQY